jgi:hypothetical protein
MARSDSDRAQRGAQSALMAHTLPGGIQSAYSCVRSDTS